MLESILRIEELDKTFYPNTVNERKALSNINLTLNHGDFVTILGSNGAGKSTLFNAICGNFYMDRGKIFLNGNNISLLAEHKRARHIGRLFQDPMKGSAPNMTIEENLALAYNRTVKGLSKNIFALNRRNTLYFKEQLSILNLGLENRMSVKVGTLSGGQRQAVSLLMSTISQPQLLLLDEHTAALDPDTAIKIMNITKNIVSTNRITTMMITHNIKSALTTGNRTIMMDEGEIILDFNQKERETMTQNDLLAYYNQKKKKELSNDRILLS